MKVVVCHSGGLDSTVLLFHLKTGGYDVSALSVNYGQRHSVELTAAERLAKVAGVQHRTADLSGIVDLLKGSSLTSHEMAVPDGHYAEQSMKATVVPNRNMILLSLAAGWAISLKADAVAYAAHSGDHAIYPDCRPEFAAAVAHAVLLADWHRVELIRPFINLAKADIVRRGSELNVPLAKTWSCYKGGELHCGRCGTCIERREAFHLARIADATPYASDAPSIESLVRSGWKIAS